MYARQHFRKVAARLVIARDAGFVERWRCPADSAGHLASAGPNEAAIATQRSYDRPL